MHLSRQLGPGSSEPVSLRTSGSPNTASLLSALVALFLAGCAAGAADDPFDFILRNGTVVDGTGNPSYHADVAVKQMRIAAIGRLTGAAASHEFDVAGMIVAPGFI